MRDIILERLGNDLIGPYTENEILTSRPSDVYLTGMLWPRETRMGAEEDEKIGLSGADESETSGATEDEEISLAGMVRPCSAGVSFAAKSTGKRAALDIRVRFATYKDVEVSSSETKDGNQGGSRTGSGQTRTDWHRHAHDISIIDVPLEEKSRLIPLNQPGVPKDVRLHLRTVPWSEGRLVTVTLLNYTQPNKDEGRNGIERLILFQVRLEIKPSRRTVLVARPFAASGAG